MKTFVSYHRDFFVIVIRHRHSPMCTVSFNHNVLRAVWEQTNFCVTVHRTLSRCKDSIENVSYMTRFGLFDKHVLCIVIDCAK